ncbi:MAG: response regulator receiver protein [Myxococcales bacterium]|nr:response regulator receiver protein [Myxococcales bacterium]
MVSTLLEKRGYSIATACDGEDGLMRADQLRPDLIITDVMMPKLDGWALVRALRSRPELALVPVIFLTALGGEEDRIRGFRLGADDYLPKPFRFEELDLRVANALKKSKQTQAKADEVRNAAVEPPPMPGVSPKKPAGIHGTLEQLGLSSLMVMIEMERKSGILRLEKLGVTGRIFCREGRVIAARLDGDRAPPNARKGAESVYHMLTWADGRFDFSAVDVDMEDEVKSTTTHLLMEGARLIDEGKR